MLAPAPTAYRAGGAAKSDAAFCAALVDRLPREPGGARGGGAAEAGGAAGQEYDRIVVNEAVAAAVVADSPQLADVLHAYGHADPTRLTLTKGDVVVLESSEGDWWAGHLHDDPQQVRMRACLGHPRALACRAAA